MVLTGYVVHYLPAISISTISRLPNKIAALAQSSGIGTVLGPLMSKAKSRQGRRVFGRSISLPSILESPKN